MGVRSTDPGALQRGAPVGRFLHPGVLAIACYLLLFASVSACGGDDTRISEGNSDVLATSERPVVSPSGRYALEVLSGRVMTNAPHGSVMVARFRISETGGKIVYEDGTDYTLRHTTYFLWADRADQVWVYSGDVGSSYVDLDKVGGGWTKHDFLPDSTTEPPAFLKRTPGFSK